MIHLVYKTNIYLNIDKAYAIRIVPELNLLSISYEQDTCIIKILEHSKVREFLEKYEGDKDEMAKHIMFEVFDIILERLSKTDEKRSSFFYLESLLNTIVYELSQNEENENE